MAYTGLQMFMAKLKHLIIYCNDDNPVLINNNPSILSQRPHFQLLYQELSSVIQTLSNIHKHHHLHKHGKVKDIKRRFKDAAKQAQDIIDLFVSAVYFRNRGLSPRSDVFITSLDLEDVMRSITSIKVEFMTININNMKMDSNPIIEGLKTEPAAAAGMSTSTRNPLETKNPLEGSVVGLDRDVEKIRDKLSEDPKQLGVVSIVGMGGIGKTTLATKVFNDRFIVYHFGVRAWATVSQTYTRRDFLIQILASIGVQQDFEEAKYPKLREKLHKQLMGQRYLIVIDDIWSIEAWDDLKLFFPNDNTGSRILLTSRLNEIALHATSHGFVHSLPCLTDEESWELLKEKVFHGDQCPEWLIEPGMKIAKQCEGLPLSVVVTAGVLAKEVMNKDLWEKIACGVGSYIASDQKGLETLALSYHHLPCHLRECFLYLGGFPEDFKFNVKRLIWLWGAEGFIEDVGSRSWEDTGKAYLMDLVDRNLFIVAKRKLNGDVTACELHDLVRELCLKKAKEERFFLKIDQPPLSSQLLETACKKQRRVFTNQGINIVSFSHPPTPSIRSLLYYSTYTSLVYDVGDYFYSFALLQVLDLQMCRLDDLPQGIALLVHLRYLAIWVLVGFSSSICNLWNLQTLILKTRYSRVILPRKVSDLVNLRHLCSNREFLLPTVEKSMNLQYISEIMFGDGVDFWKCFPTIKKLAITCHRDGENHFELLPYLEILKLRGGFHRNHIWFPATLKKLTVLLCFLPWSDMSIFQSLPNLEVLKVKQDAFTGTHWNASAQQFRRLKFLRLDKLNIQQWEAQWTSFPCLKRLSLRYCKYLEKIPLEIGEITTLELIETNKCSNSVLESLKRIQKEQYDEGNTELKITVDGMELSINLSEHEDSESEWE